MTKTVLLAAALALSPLLGKAARAQDESGEEVPPPPPPPDDESTATPPPSEAQPPAEQPTQQTFEQRLSPYGRWVDTPEYGRVWVPYNTGSDWQPYTDGRWVDTAYGWSFVATVPWGWATYHYGRWAWGVGIGWYWVPGYRWGPGWVAWRYTHGYACWAPLAPRGYVYGRAWPGWVVVPHAHFTAPIHRWVVPRAQVGVIVRTAHPLHAYPSVRARAVVNARPTARHRGAGRRR
jgi:hypothetical protein